MTLKQFQYKILLKIYGEYEPILVDAVATYRRSGNFCC